MQKFWKIEDSKANKRRKKFKQGKQNLYRIACEMGWSNCKYQDLTILYWSKINNFFVCKMKLLFILKKYLLFTILSFLMKSGNAHFKNIYKYEIKNRPKQPLFSSSLWIQTLENTTPEQLLINPIQELSTLIVSVVCLTI